MGEPRESIYDEWQNAPDPDPSGTPGLCQHWPGQRHCDVCGYTARTTPAAPDTSLREALDAHEIRFGRRNAQNKTEVRCKCGWRDYFSPLQTWADHREQAVRDAAWTEWSDKALPFLKDLAADPGADAVIAAAEAWRDSDWGDADEFIQASNLIAAVDAMRNGR